MRQALGGKRHAVHVGSPRATDLLQQIGRARRVRPQVSARPRSSPAHRESRSNPSTDEIRRARSVTTTALEIVYSGAMHSAGAVAMRRDKLRSLPALVVIPRAGLWLVAPRTTWSPPSSTWRSPTPRADAWIARATASVAENRGPASPS